MTKDPRSYTTIDIARRLGVSLQTVQRWVDAGHLKAWKTLGGHRRIEAASAERLFREQEERLGTAPQRPAEATEPPPVCSVVVVDDDPLDVELLVLLVQQALPEARIATADNGFQGLVVIGRTAPQIVITDIHMPHMDGFEMIRNLLDGGTQGPRNLIAVSALSASELARHGNLPPGVMLFTKPLDKDSFVAALQKLA